MTFFHENKCLDHPLGMFSENMGSIRKTYSYGILLDSSQYIFFNINFLEFLKTNNLFNF